MSRKVQTLRGMKDQLPLEKKLYRFIENTFLDTARLFHYQEISTPLLEDLKVFDKTIGEDIVGKELYQFKDKGEHLITLRPEGTASVVRMVINEGLLEKKPLRLLYCGPMFRYERPQKGRLRQFHQIGIEYFGKKSPYADFEVLQIAHTILKKLGVSSTLLINSLGDQESRYKYKKALVQYLEPFKKELSADSQVRLKTNPLRILDSKSKQDQKILEKAPLPKNFLNKDSQSFFEQVIFLLEKNNISYQLEDFLVRGLDYYSDTVFEFVSSELSAQNAVLSGGRYDSLVESMGGESCPAIGWACGLERLALVCSEKPKEQKVFSVLSTQDQLNKEVWKVAQKLREFGASVYLPQPDSPFKKQMKQAHKENCSHVVILGEDEWKNNQVIVKDMETGKQKLYPKNLFHLSQELLHQHPTSHSTID